MAYKTDRVPFSFIKAMCVLDRIQQQVKQGTLLIMSLLILHKYLAVIEFFLSTL